MSVFHISLSKNSPTQRGALFVKVFSLLPVILKLAILIDKDLEQKNQKQDIFVCLSERTLGFQNTQFCFCISWLFLFCYILFLHLCMLLPSFSPIKMEVCWEWHFTAQQGEIIKKDNILTQTSYSFPLLLVSSLSDLQKIKIKVKIILVLLGHNSFLWLPLCSTCQQSFPSLLWLLSPSHHPGVCLLFFQAL